MGGTVQRVDQRVRSAWPSLFNGTVPHQGLQISVNSRSGKLCGIRDRGKRLFSGAEPDQGTEHCHGARHGADGAVGRRNNRVQQREFPLAVEDLRVSHNARSIQWLIVPGQDLAHQALSFPVREFQEQSLLVIRRGGPRTRRRGGVEG